MVKQKVKVIELEATELKQGSRYIFRVSPGALLPVDEQFLYDELRRLLGHDKFIVLNVPEDAFKVYEVAEDIQISGAPLPPQER